MLPWNLVWNVPETEPSRTAVSASYPFEVLLEQSQAKGKTMTALQSYWNGVTTAQSRKLLKDLKKLANQ